MILCDGVPWNAEDGMGIGSFAELLVVVVLSTLVEKLSMVNCVLGLFSTSSLR